MALIPTTDVPSLTATAFSAHDQFIINTQFVRWVFEFIGIPGAPEDVLTEVARTVAFRIQAIISEARKMAMKANRTSIIEIDIDTALTNRGFDTFLLNGSVHAYSSLSRIISNNRSVNDIYFFCDEEVDIDDYLADARTKIKLAQELCLKSHWLGINGIQPSIPENPQKNEISVYDTKRNTDSIELTFHLQLFYKDLTETSIGTIEEKRREALLSLQRDHSIKYLLVPLCSFIYQGIRVNIAGKNLAILIYIMRMVCSIIQNSSIPPEMMENHFNEIIPSILSCILSPDLCSKKFEENHWALRVYSAKLVCNLCNNFESFIPHLRSNVVELLNTGLKRYMRRNLDFSDEAEVFEFPFGTFFGVFFTFSQMPRDVMATNTLQHAKMFGGLFEELSKRLETISHEFLKRDILKAEHALIQNICNFTSEVEMSNRSYLEEKFGIYLTEKLFKSLSDVNNKV